MLILCSWKAEILSHPVCLKSPGLLRKDSIYLRAWTSSGAHANSTQEKKGLNRTAHLQMQIMNYKALYNNYRGSLIHPKSWPESKVRTMPLESELQQLSTLNPSVLWKERLCGVMGILTLKWVTFLVLPLSTHHVTFWSVRHKNLVWRKEVLWALVLGVQRNFWLRYFERC